MRDDDWAFDEDEDEDQPDNMCPQCGMIVPPSHLETDTGVCISCEEMNDEAEDDEDAL